MSLHTMQLSLLHLQLESRRHCSKTCRQGILCGVARNNEPYAPVSVRRDLRERYHALIQRKRLQRLHEEKEWERAIKQEEEHRQKNSTLKEEVLSRRYRPPTSIPSETRNDDETRSNAWKRDATLKDDFETRGSGRLANHQKRHHHRMAAAKLQRQRLDTANAPGESFVEGMLLNKIGSHSSGAFQSALASAFMRNQLQLKASRFRDLVEAVQKRHENEDPYRERRNNPSISEPEASPSSVRWPSYDYNHPKNQLRLHSKKQRPRAPHKGQDDVSGTPPVTRLQTETTSINDLRKSFKNVSKETEGGYIDW